MKLDYVDFDTFAKQYCDKQDTPPDGLRSILRDQLDRYEPVGWVMMECQVLDTSKAGRLAIVPYGPSNTWQTIPQTPVSLDGTASGTSVPVAVLLADRFREVLHGPN